MIDSTEDNKTYNDSCTPLLTEGDYTKERIPIFPLNLNIKQLPNVKTILGDDIETMLVCNLLAKDKVSYNRDNSITIPKKYNRHSYSNYRILKAVDRLVNKGYVYSHVAEYKYNADYEEIEQSYIQATPLLKATFDKRQNRKKSNESYKTDIQTVILKDKDGNMIDYSDNSFTRESRNIIDEYNKAAMKYDVCLDDVKFDVVLRSHHKVSFDNYGRLFAMGNSHQNMKKEDRHRITINGEQVAEIDYQNLHLKMLLDHYKLADSFPVGADLYSLALTEEQKKNPANRKLVKLMVMTAINNKSRWESIRAFNHKVMRENINTGDFQSSENVMLALENGIPELFKNKAILQNMYSGFLPMAAFLQKKDSTICKDVLQQCERMKVFVLPVHDSFITPLCNADIVGRIMGDSYRKVMSVNTLVPCSVSVDGDTWETTY